MKKILISIVLLFIPFIVSAQNVTIKSIELVKKGDSVEELEQAKYEGLKVSFNLKFSEVGDFATYLVTIKNGDNEDYKLNTTPNKESKYITYEYDTKADNDVIKANSESKIYITAKYTKEVPSYALENNKYTETKQIGLSLVSTDGTKEIVNPNTGNVIKIGKFTIPVHTIGIIIAATILAIVVIKNKKVIKYTNYVLLLSLLMIPTTILAIKEIKIDIETTIEIEKITPKKITVIIIDGDLPEREIEIEYIDGMSWDEWEKSKYNKKKLHLIEFNPDSETCEKGYVIMLGTGTRKTIASIELSSQISSDKNYVLYYENCEVSASVYQSNSGDYQPIYGTFGMTFGEWLESDYNEDHIEFVDYNSIPNKENINLSSGYTPVSYSDTIKQGQGYEIVTVSLDGNEYQLLCEIMETYE